MATGIVAITGLGLIGGSLARDLAARGITVLGYDPDPATLRAALDAGVISGTLDPDLGGVEGAEILILAAPVGRAPGILTATADRLRHLRLVTDVGSTKQGIAAAAEEAGLAHLFVGGHPLAGDHRAGWTASRTGLFQDARVFLSPTPATAPAALACAHELWSAIGARTEEVDAVAHDHEIAWVSHLPQAASTALALALARAGIGPDRLGPGGRDMTRLAASSPTVWTEIALENAAALGQAIQTIQAQLERVRLALEERDAEGIQEFFARGKGWSQGQGGRGRPRTHP